MLTKICSWSARLRGQNIFPLPAGYEAVGRVEYAAEQWQRSPARKRGSASAAWLSLHQRWQHAGWLIRTIVIAVGILLVFNVLSSGAFYGFRGPHERELPREVREDIRDIYILAGAVAHSLTCQC